MSARKRVVTIGLFILLGGALLAFFQLAHFGTITGFFVFEVAEEEFPDDFYVVSSVLNEDENTLLVDYYPAAYIGTEEESTILYRVVDSSGAIIVEGEKQVVFDVNPKSKFILEIPLSDALPDSYDIELELIADDETVVEQTSFDSSDVTTNP